MIGIKQYECESFMVGDQLYHLCSGILTTDLNMPAHILNLRIKEMEHDSDAQHSLNQMEITDKDARLLQFCKCRYGGYDNIPDTVMYQSNTPDYWNCGKRGLCKEEFSLCRPIMAPNGRLFRKEIEVVKLIALDLADKQIAEKMEVSENTIHSHRYNITKKIGCSSKNGIVAFAYEKGILNNK